MEKTKPESVKEILDGAKLYRDGLEINLIYPRNEDSIKHLLIGLMDTRAADDLRISYDFERDGWKIEQSSIFSWDCDDEVCDPDWQEVAFIKAWQRQTERDSKTQIKDEK